MDRQSIWIDLIWIDALSTKTWIDWFILPQTRPLPQGRLAICRTCAPFTNYDGRIARYLSHLRSFYKFWCTYCSLFVALALVLQILMGVLLAICRTCACLTYSDDRLASYLSHLRSFNMFCWLFFMVFVFPRSWLLLYYWIINKHVIKPKKLNMPMPKRDKNTTENHKNQKFSRDKEQSARYLSHLLIFDLSWWAYCSLLVALALLL